MTRAHDLRPVVRVVTIPTYPLRDLVASVGASMLWLRPYRTRKGGPAEVSIPWGMIYTYAVRLHAEKAWARPRRKVRRGVRL